MYPKAGYMPCDFHKIADIRIFYIRYIEYTGEMLKSDQNVFETF